MIPPKELKEAIEEVQKQVAFSEFGRQLMAMEPDIGESFINGTKSLDTSKIPPAMVENIKLAMRFSFQCGFFAAATTADKYVALLLEKLTSASSSESVNPANPQSSL